MTYYTVHTPAGLAELAAAQVAQQFVPFTHIALGDGNGQEVVPDGRTALVNEVDRVQISSIRKHPTNPAWFIFEAAVPEEVGGYTVRELALIGGRVPGICMAVGNYPTTDKPLPGEGAPRALVFRMVVVFANAATVNVSVDPQAHATAATVQQAIEDHEAKADPHAQYLTYPEGAAMVAAHADANDPHPQYLTAAEGEALVAAHAGVADPHPQYLTQAEGDGRYAQLGNLLTADVLKALRAARALRFFHAAGM